MLCPKCGYYAETDEIVCPECGEVLQRDSGEPVRGAQAIRQGKRARQARDNKGREQPETKTRRRRSGASHATLEMPAVPDTRGADTDDRDRAEEGSDAPEDPPEPDGSGYERRNRPIYDESGIRAEQAESFAASYAKRKQQHVSEVNWMKISFVAVIAAALLMAGTWLFLEKTDSGQRIMARMGLEANSTALWAVGEEQLNRGDVQAAINSFEKAKEMDEASEHPDVDGLLLLGNAYEAAGRVQDAANLYEEIYLGTPFRTEAYVNHIRILQASGDEDDLARAAELMKLAYEKTGDYTFKTQRDDLLPAPPKVDLTAAYYESKKRIEIWSYQGFDVYYTFSAEGELPECGVKYTERVLLDEGEHNLRAVAVNGKLVSDELRATYKIVMPSPRMPRATLAPGPYKSRQKVRLKPGLDNMDEDGIVIYYTIDGSPPGSDSPIFDGDPILLPTGDHVVLKAIAVNKYKKSSNPLEVKYKISVAPYPLTAYTPQDSFSDLTLYETTMMEFQSIYGEGNLDETLMLEGFATECRKYVYPWGYAIMNKPHTEWVLTELYVESSGVFKAPRGTDVGDTASYVVSRFRDMGQVASPSGNRGLYQNDSGRGIILAQANKESIIRYRAVTAEGNYWQLDYLTNSAGNVKAVDWLYCP